MKSKEGKNEVQVAGEVEVVDAATGGGAGGAGAEGRIGVASAAIPILRKLRSRIRAYAALWAAAGIVSLLVAIPAFRERSYVLGTATLLFGGCVAFFALVRASEAKGVSAIIEADRSEARRKAFLAVNAAVFALSLAAFTVSLVWAPPSLNPWIALPVSAFVMIVSISPAWEWLFIRRVISANRDTLEEFNRCVTLIYGTKEARQTALAALDALYLLDALRAKGVLSQAAFRAVQMDLLGG